MSRVQALLVLGGLAAAVLVLPAVELDPFGAFLVALALVSGSVALLRDVVPGRVVLEVGLVIVTVSTRHLFGMAVGSLGLAFLASPAAVLPVVAILGGILLLAAAGGSLDLGSIGASGAVATGSTLAALGVFLLVLGWCLLFAVVSRRTLEDPRQSLAGGASSAVAALLAAGGAMTRVSAWLPDLDAVIEPSLTAAGILALAAGSVGTLASERLRAFVGWLAIAQGGLVALALLGGVHGRPAILMQLATSAVAIVFVAVACARRRQEEPLTLDALASAALSRAFRALGLSGAVAALSLPPFPGFPARLVTASALLGRGEVTIFVLSLAATVVLALGILRVAVALLEAPRARAERRRTAELLALALTLAALVLLGLSPGPLVEAARVGAAGLF